MLAAQLDAAPGLEGLAEDAVAALTEMYRTHDQSFKVETRRARKSYPVPSMEVNAYLGGKLLEAFPEMRVDVHTPEITLHV